MNINSLSFYIDDKEYLFEQVGELNDIVEENGYYTQQAEVVFDEKSEDFFWSDGFIVAESIPVILHGDEDILVWLESDAIKDLENLYFAMIGCGGDFDVYVGQPMSINNSTDALDYIKGMQAMDSGNTTEAIGYFSKVVNYRNAMKNLLECFEAEHIQYRWMTKNTGDVVNAGGNGYSEKKPIMNDDPHFGWSLGRFLLSGYTEFDDSTGIPTFIKTPGDSIDLWFDLEQDIDKLNGNDFFSISEDTDGYDQEFGVPKTNMGRGMLLIRHTDSNNSDGVPQKYANYLAASGMNTANTKVEINEEGDYEVALDYEIRDSDLLHKLKQFYNYRISFKFRVKNGSSMFYMFDLGTGAELEDYSRTSEGFRIDLANSHSLKIDIVRYALNQAGNGLDVRASAPASDNDQFDRTGYYIITVTNTETKEKVTKHIFVGNKGDLADYQDADASLKLFSK